MGTHFIGHVPSATLPARPFFRVEILLVENNPTDLELTMHAFRGHSLANRVHVARDGAEAIDFLFSSGANGVRTLEEGPKVILLDLKLPKVDGLQPPER